MEAEKLINEDTKEAFTTPIKNSSAPIRSAPVDENAGSPAFIISPSQNINEVQTAEKMELKPLEEIIAPKGKKENPKARHNIIYGIKGYKLVEQQYFIRSQSLLATHTPVYAKFALGSFQRYINDNKYWYTQRRLQRQDGAECQLRNRNALNDGIYCRRCSSVSNYIGTLWTHRRAAPSQISCTM